MSTKVQISSKIFGYSLLEPKDEVDERLEKCHGEYSSLIAHLRENEVYSQLTDKVSRSAQDHDDTMMALLYSILTDPVTASKSYHTLNLVSRDSLASVTTQAERIVMEKMMKLQDPTQTQLLWLIRSMVETKVAGADKLIFALLKQLPTGSVSNPAVLLAENTMHLILDNREWVVEQPGLVSSVVFTYLSLIACYTSPALTGLREQAAHMCVDFIRTRFEECLAIGRDLVRLLQVISRVPEVTELWKDMFLSPQKLGPQFTGVGVLLSRRTSRRFIAARIVADAEIKLNFLLSKVKFGQHSKYQEWFQRKYLSSPESMAAIPELIRFICCVIHPTNEILASDVIPRWAVLGWLLSLAQPNPVLFGYSKLSLFYDWLAYNPDTDNIMNIEPGILLMHHSLRSHPQLTASLLDFICRQAAHYHPDLTALVSDGVKNAFKDVLQKGVLLSLDPLFESPKLDDSLRTLVRETFPELCHQVVPLATVEKVSGEEREEPAPLVVEEEDLGGEDPEVIGAFSDSEQDGGEGFVSLTPKMMEEGSSGSSSSCDPWSAVEGLPPPIRDTLLTMKEECDQEKLEKLLLELLSLVQATSDDAHDGDVSELLPVVAPPLSEVISRAEQDISSDKNTLTLALFRSLAATPVEVSVALPLTGLLASHHSRLGYQLLHYLSQSKPGRLSLYKEVVSGSSKDKFTSVLVNDLEECVEADGTVFYKLVPLVYKQFFKELMANQKLLNLVVANIDPAQLHMLMQKLSMKEFQIFGKQTASIKELIDASTEWDSFEQFCVWQLLCAEGPDPQTVIPALIHLNEQDHPEAMSSALVFLRTESTTFPGVGALLSLPLSLSSLVDAVCVRWISGRPAKYGKLISQFLEEATKNFEDKLFSESEVLNCVLAHLERLISVLPSIHILESSEMLLSHTLSTLFTTDSKLKAMYGTLHSTISSLLESAKSDGKGESTKRGKHSEVKPKKRKT